ncbi:MAG: hypothetical protein HY348_09185 [Nitrospira defluvii]|nr:hypothetical protein [Nitrospira defluvii]
MKCNCMMRALFALWLGAACTPEADVTPPHLIGVWETRSAGYTDQHMVIDQHRIGFGTSAVTADGYVVTQIRESQEGSKTLYLVTYQGAEQVQYQLAFYYEPTEGGRITFKNQNHLTWTRKESAT